MSNFPQITPRPPQSPSGNPAPPPPSSPEDARLAQLVNEIRMASQMQRRALHEGVRVLGMVLAVLLAMLSALTARMEGFGAIVAVAAGFGAMVVGGVSAALFLFARD